MCTGCGGGCGSLGYSYTASIDGVKTCDPCAGGYYQNLAHHWSKCKQCAAACSFGTIETTACTATTNRVCSRRCVGTPTFDPRGNFCSCDAGFHIVRHRISPTFRPYSHRPRYSWRCLACRPSCGSSQRETTACTPTTNRVCSLLPKISKISYYFGKVNQYFDTVAGVWKSDPDKSSGANINKLTYCQKWYPLTTSFLDTEQPETLIFCNAGQTTCNYTATRDVFECVSATASQVPIYNLSLQLQTCKDYNCDTNIYDHHQSLQTQYGQMSSYCLWVDGKCADKPDKTCTKDGCTAKECCTVVKRCTVTDGSAVNLVEPIKNCLCGTKECSTITGFYCVSKFNLCQNEFVPGDIIISGAKINSSLIDGTYEWEGSTLTNGKPTYRLSNSLLYWDLTNKVWTIGKENGDSTSTTCIDISMDTTLYWSLDVERPEFSNVGGGSTTVKAYNSVGIFEDDAVVIVSTKACLNDNGMKANEKDCTCGINDCTHFTGMFCLASSSKCSKNKGCK